MPCLRPLRRGLQRAALALGMALAACSSGESTPGKLTVFAAASCADWVEDLPGRNNMRLQLGPSSGLARQIADGAPADVFITADGRWIDFLGERGLVDGPRIAFARNSLVCVALQSTTFENSAPTSLAELSGALSVDDRISIADESVPAGDYARQALSHASQLEPLRPHFVGQDDARSTLRSVIQGQAKVGFVYASDALLDRVRILFPLDSNTHDAIQYWACSIRRDVPSMSGAAHGFLLDLHSAPVQDLLLRSGFQLEKPIGHLPQHQ
ncbi:MAG: molybdate ABC transporter substrate-binding protein [Planctomycetota bacterium]|nr:molybdate ABC transporter substrate-binding protein [Planctomycetota bacterium]